MRGLLLAGVLYLLASGGALGHAEPRLQGTEVFRVGQHRAPAFTLRDQNGHWLALRTLRGHIVAVTFLDSQCHEQCPVEGRELAVVQHRLGRHTPLVVLAITVAPHHDTPASVRHFMREMGMTGRWYWLTGSPAALRRVWRDYGIAVWSTKAGPQHTSALYLLDHAGWIRVADGIPLLPYQLVESVRALLR